MRNANAGVLNLEAHGGVRLGLTCDADAYHDLSLRREFDSITDHVGQDLTQSACVPAQPRMDVGGNGTSWFYPFAMSGFGQHVQGAFDRADELKSG